MERVYLKHALVALMVLGAVLLGGFYIYNRYLLTPEQKILACVERMRLAGVEKSARRIMAEVAPDYRDELIPNRDDLAQKVQYWCVLNLKEDVVVTLTGLLVQVAADGQSAKVRFVVGGSKPVTSVLQLLNQSGAVELDYVNQDGNWLIRGAHGLK